MLNKSLLNILGFFRRNKKNSEQEIISEIEQLKLRLETNIKYSEYLAENLETNIKYSEYLAENLETNIKYSEYLAENRETNIKYSEYLTKNKKIESKRVYSDIDPFGEEDWDN